MKQTLNLIMSVFITAAVVACSAGETGQSMPIGGTAFTGTFTPGIGNLTTAGANACASNGPEQLTFIVQESTTVFYDLNIGSGTVPIIQGSFVNGGQNVNQNNPCFNGVVTYSTCGPAQTGKITFNACSVNLLGSTYQFLATYYLYSGEGISLGSGTINAYK
jgi:hypothetical protein